MSHAVLKNEKNHRIETIPVSKIICVALNYTAHAIEMQSTKPQEPVLFLKPPSAIIRSGQSVIYPSISNQLHHEIEVVLLIGKQGKHIPRQQAIEYILGYGIGLDMTLRDVQQEAKQKGQPWAIAKGFDTSAPISDFIRSEAVANPLALAFELRVNDQLRQQGNTSNMLFPIDVLIAYTTCFFTLNRGDLIFTGTPEGVGPVQHHDQLKASLLPWVDLEVDIQKRVLEY